MNKLKWSIVVVFVAMFLTACSKEDEILGEDYIPLMVDVELNTPEQVEVGEEVKIDTYVSQGGEAIEDAEEVIYEVWEESKKVESQMIPATNDGKGHYSMKETFPHDGIFHVQVHVTARNLHVMPVQKIQVGEGAVYEEEVKSDTSAYIQTNDVESGKEETLIVHLTRKGVPLKEAPVEFFIHEGEQQPIPIEVNEKDRGEYQAVYTFKQPGFAKLEVRVKDESLFKTMETINVR